MTKTVDILKHTMVPKHTLISEEETKKVLTSYNISLSQLPKILKSDPAIKSLGPKAGNVIKISRTSPTAGNIEFYRVVING